MESWRLFSVWIWQVLYHIAREAAETRPRYWVGCFPPGSPRAQFLFGFAKLETTINGKDDS